MFRLLDIDKNNNVIITPEALMIEAFGNLWKRDKTKDKSMYIKEVGVIYYLADPKGPCKQEGLSDAEALKKAIDNFDLPKTYQPDLLVWKLIKRYYEEKIIVFFNP